MKTLVFVLLYIYSAIRDAVASPKEPDSTLRGEIVFSFLDPDIVKESTTADPQVITKPKKKHGVVAFVLPNGRSPDDYKADMFGPFGYSSKITIRGVHLYGRDTWGTVDQTQIAANPELKELSAKYPGRTILLAGVRKFMGRHVSPLNDARSFLLVLK
jgi:hypothetical protein